MVVAIRDDFGHDIFYPVHGTPRPEIIQEQNFDLHDAPKSVLFRRPRLFAPAALNIRQQLLIIVKQAIETFTDDLLQRADSEMGFAGARIADQKQAGLVDRG